MEIIIWRFPKIGVPPKSSCFDKVFHYKPYIVGYPHFRKTIYVTFADHGPSEPWQLWVDPMRSSCFNAASVAAEGLSRNGNWQLSTGWRPLDRRCQKTGYTALVNVYVICGYLFKYICIFIETERERERLKMTCVYWKLSVQSDPVLDRVYVCLSDTGCKLVMVNWHMRKSGHFKYLGVSINGGTPQNGGFIMKSPTRIGWWLIWLGGPYDFGKPPCDSPIDLGEFSNHLFWGNCLAGDSHSSVNFGPFGGWKTTS